MTATLLLLTASLLGQTAPETFTSEAGKFQVDFPSEPDEQTVKVPTGAGNMDTHMFIAKVGNTASIVIYADYPSAVLKSKRKKAVLVEARDLAIAAARGKLADSRDVTFEDNPGLAYEYTIEKPGQPKFVNRSRIYLVGKRLYQVIDLAPEGDAEDDEARATALFDSFRLTRPDGAAKKGS